MCPMLTDVSFKQIGFEDTQAHKVAVLMNGSTAPSETFTSTPINTAGANKRLMAEPELVRVLLAGAS